VTIKDVNEYSTIVELLEYNNKEGMITSNEYTRQSGRAGVIKIRKIGRTEPCVVIRVDEQNGGFIDLSKKRVKKDEVASIEEKYSKGKTVQSIIRAVVERTGEDIGHLYETIVWPLQERYPHALDAFNQAHGDFDKAFQGLNISESVKVKLIEEIGRRLTPQPTKIAAYFEVNCYNKEGIDAIKEALRAGEALSTPEFKITVTLITPPSFEISTTAQLNKKKAIEAVELSLKAIEESICAKGGIFRLKKAAYGVSNNDKDFDQNVIDDDGKVDPENDLQFEDEEEN